VPFASPAIHAAPGRALDAARAGYWENPEGSLAVAIAARAGARARGDRPLEARPSRCRG